MAVRDGFSSEQEFSCEQEFSSEQEISSEQEFSSEGTITWCDRKFQSAIEGSRSVTKPFNRLTFYSIIRLDPQCQSMVRPADCGADVGSMWDEALVCAC